MRITVLILLLTAAPAPASAQTFDSYRAFRDSLEAVVTMADAGARDATLRGLWNALKAEGQVPFRHRDSVAFLHFEQETDLSVAGDFNRWSSNAWQAARLGETWIWIREATFPTDARLDYKFVTNGGGAWILDPANPRRQWGGFGPNSELRMPDYEPSPFVDRVAGRANGSYTQNIALASPALGYSVNYRVYTPPEYESGLANLPVVYVTDGHEYADDRLGSMRAVLDNMIAEDLIVPVIAVFIDPRVGSDNRRGSQYIQNSDFARFVAEELVPEIDRAYRTMPHRDSRAILGTSLGGLNAAYFGAIRPETFRNIAIQSPAFSGRSWIFDLYRDEPLRDTKIHMTWGTINDVGPGAEEMASVMESKGYDLTTKTVSEGHSWGAWRALIDDALVTFFPQSATVDVATGDVPRLARLESVYPNPSSGRVTITYSANGSKAVSFAVHDVLGRNVASMSPGLVQSGLQELVWDAGNLIPGVYFLSLRAEGVATHTRSIAVY
ncbi:MAG: enterochelin esterase-like enzyme [Rhodothermales bacterium]|jgi:enterochelin esterase-like enzyme